MAKANPKQATLQVRCTPEQKAAFEDYARTQRTSVSSLLLKFVERTIAKNTEQIKSFRAVVDVPKKSARRAKKKPVDAESVTGDGDDLKVGGGDVEENS